LAFRVSLQVTVVAVVHPLHEAKGLFPALAGAVSVIDVPEEYVRLKLVVPLPALFTSAGVTAIATPLRGFFEATVSTYVVAVAAKAFPPPATPAAIPRLRPNARTAANLSLAIPNLLLLEIPATGLERALIHRMRHAPFQSIAVRRILRLILQAEG
jgi:hypothetical protein